MLWYYDLSRRKFLKILGLSAMGVSLAGPSLRAGTETASGRVAAGPADALLPMHEAIASAVHLAGARVVTCVPATGTAMVFDALNAISRDLAPYSYNEEVAYTLAHGAALTGARAAAIVKAHGLAKAANSVIDSLTAGTTAGLVAIVTTDPQARHSDSIFDAAAFVRGSGIPFTTPRPEGVFEAVRNGFRWSEELQLPVAVLVDAGRLRDPVPAGASPLPPVAAAYARDPMRHVLCPPLAGYQHRVLRSRLAGQGWQAAARPAALRIPDSLPPAWREWIGAYEPVFEAFRGLRARVRFVSGDTGLASLFAFAPYDCIDACTYYGGSLPLAAGACLAGRQAAWAVTGDYAFVAAGQMGLVEALSRRIPLKVLVLHNGCALTTGGQPIAAGVLEYLLAGSGGAVRRVAASAGVTAVAGVLEQAMASDGLEIVVADLTAPA